jgi:hypothetical protein
VLRLAYGAADHLAMSTIQTGQNRKIAFVAAKRVV